MKLIFCKKCGIEKEEDKFYLRNGITRHSVCKNCEAIRKQIYYKNNTDKELKRTEDYKTQKPWCKTLVSLRGRCNNINRKDYRFYGGRGIKALITLNELEKLWVRDKADLMTRPSIERNDNLGDYTFENCCYIEHNENCRKRNRKGDKND